MEQKKHELQCRCGEVRGYILSPKPGCRVICYCQDCQAFAHYLNRADELLDTAGGSDVVQTSPRQIVFTQGQGSIACMRLTEQGLLRWYTRCCNTPLGNTPANYKVAFVGLSRACLVGDDTAVTDAFGSVCLRANGESAKGPVPANSPRMLLGLFYLCRLLLSGRVLGRYRQTPFFHADTGLPTVAPKVLTDEELKAVNIRRENWKS